MVIKHENEMLEDTAIMEKDYIPGMYNVVFHNDDYTPMDFVVLVLMKVFLKSYEDAHQLMSDVDRKGKGIAGTYTKEIAIIKMKQVEDISTQEDFPLQVTIEENK